MLKRFSSRPEAMKAIRSGRALAIPELEQPEWMEELHVMVEMTVHLSTLNTTLQQKGGTAMHMIGAIWHSSANWRSFPKIYRDLNKLISPLWNSSNKLEIRSDGSFCRLQSLHYKSHLENDSWTWKMKEICYPSISLSWPSTHPDWRRLHLQMYINQIWKLTGWNSSNKVIWVSKLQRLIVYLEVVARQMAVFAHDCRWRETDRSFANRSNMS